MDLTLAIAALFGVGSVSFALGYSFGANATRRFRRRMTDIERARKNIAWPIGHKGPKE
jgi:hypothetical protein